MTFQIPILILPNWISKNNKMVKVGIGVIIEKEGKILIGKRKNSHAPFYSIPGGHLEEGESFEKAAVREILEETGLKILDPKVISLTNNLETYKLENVHYISVILFTDKFEGEPQIMEPEKCESWQWCDPHQLPQPHFDASSKGINCFLNKRFY